MTRVYPIEVHSCLLSSYGKRGGTSKDILRSQLVPLRELSIGNVTPDTADAMLALHIAVDGEGGDLRFTEAKRDIGMQADARAKYLRWLSDGKPKVGKGYNSSVHKNAFVSRPGRSFHNGARAIDVHIAALRFPVLRDDQVLDRLWELAIPLGWTPVIKKPDETARESWHMDFMGPWSHVKDRLGYEQAAMCACLDIGEGREVFERYEQRCIQAQLHRAGFNVGDVDGYLGKRTKAALNASGIGYVDDSLILDTIERVNKLRTKPLHWTYHEKP